MAARRDPPGGPGFFRADSQASFNLASTDGVLPQQNKYQRVWWGKGPTSGMGRMSINKKIQARAEPGRPRQRSSRHALASTRREVGTFTLSPSGRGRERKKGRGVEGAVLPTKSVPSALTREGPFRCAQSRPLPTGGGEGLLLSGKGS